MCKQPTAGNTNPQLEPVELLSAVSARSCLPFPRNLGSHKQGRRAQLSVEVGAAQIQIRSHGGAGVEPAMTGRGGPAARCAQRCWPLPFFPQPRHGRCCSAWFGVAGGHRSRVRCAPSQRGSNSQREAQWDSGRTRTSAWLWRHLAGLCWATPWTNGLRHGVGALCSPCWSTGAVTGLGTFTRVPFGDGGGARLFAFVGTEREIYKASKQTKSHNGSNSEFKYHLHSRLANLLRKKHYFSTKILGAWATQVPICRNNTKYVKKYLYGTPSWVGK